MQSRTPQVPPAGTIEVAFSPDEGAEALVVRAIDSAIRSVRILAYSFTSAPVTEALLRARKRGVDIAVVADAKNNLSEDRSGKARAALGALVTAGIPVRTVSVFAIHHDKTIVVDSQTTETGSFNFSSAAAHRNSENALVVWGNPQLAAIYQRHWERNWSLGVDYRPSF
ncbi:phospholipase D family protein [Ralstonia sp. ASV6]|uniref:phospholipase D family nuclease n=1 Tax=Ralstonia sp. ASV6 TaxID=2795124 RepID=UPI001E2E7F39|nr:phospholipase D family protein [Ralstonia sp. ASV6]